MKNNFTYFLKLSLTILACWASIGTCASAADMPDFAKVEAMVHRHFATLPGHESGDLICRNQVRPIFASIERLGWKVADEATILNSVLPDNNYLVEEFRKGDGQKFMRKVIGSPLAMDRLDQLSRLPGGKLMVQDFLRFPNSELTLTKNKAMDVSRLARFQPRDKQSGITQADLNKPTGRIYTADALVARLRQSYDEELKRREALQR